ncbi:alkaline phosphatase family protein [Paenibacillus sp. MBLB4367]|uniref:alkaline phosphatase family protein n=1 Tax=Paenibacillus sp. MBLB4367 TaxID=3384767 RepID=UPI0039083E0B
MMSRINRVLVLGIDGAGQFAKNTDIPNIRKLFEKGALTFEAQTVYPSISAECWGAMFHGVNPEKHKLTNEIAAAQAFPEDSPYPSFMKLARQAWPDCKLAAFSEWSPINRGIIEESCSFHAVSVSVPELAEQAADYIRANPDVKVLYMQFDHVDGAGHKFGYGEEGHLDSITECDGHIGTVLQAVEEAGLMEDSLILVTTDHGGGGDGKPRSHGSADPLDMTIFWGCYGPGIAPGTKLPSGITIKDTAAVVAYALGLEAPAEWEGKVPEGLFTA